MPLMISSILFFVALGFAVDSALANTGATVSPPNIIVILADDMGYGDMSSNGHPTIRTPHLDQMVREGQKWTNFYAPASVCSPSRAGLLTGRLPIRAGVASLKHRVFFPWSKGGLPLKEVTLAEMLKQQAYQTAMFGKWHLGHLPQFLPTQHGFDTWFGIPYSNDMDRDRKAVSALKDSSLPIDFPLAYWSKPQSQHFNVPLMAGDQVIERAPDQRMLTRTYTDKSLAFIRRQQDKPFFLYLSFSMPHVPLFRSPAFEGKSTAGLYGDVIEELDASVGRIIAELKSLNIADNTLVVFTSDNGPWLKYKTLGGSAGLLKEGKSTAWEGGMRVPTVFWGPGFVTPGLVHSMGSSLDFMATFAALSDAKLPDVLLDSVNLLPVLNGISKKSRDKMFFYLGDQLAAVRQGAYKAHFLSRPAGQQQLELNDPPLLFDLNSDPAEQFEIGRHYPDIISNLSHLRSLQITSVKKVENQLIKR